MNEEKIINQKNHIKEVGGAIKERMFGYIAAGLGLVAGLAWNDAIKLLIEHFIPKIGNAIVAKIVYAIMLTLIVAIVLFYVEQYLSEPEKEETK